MQKAVQASNFKIPLESLASLFQFAQARARETGESVEYLTNSIVLGIGRKSPLILDNLGISAVELRKRLKGVGVEAANVGDIAAIIGDIATEELEKMGDQADTTADKLAQITTAFENIKVVIGAELINQADDLFKSFDGINEQLSKLFDTSDSAEVWSKALQFGLKSLTTGFRVAGAVLERTLLIVNGVKDGIEELFNMAKQDLADAGILYQVQEQSEQAERSIKGLNSAIASVYKMMKEGAGANVSLVNSINELNKELKEYQTDLKNAEIGSTEFFAIVDKITAKTKELNEAIAMTKLSDALKVDIEEEVDITGAVIDYPNEVERATSIADDLWQEHFEKLMAAQDAAFENDKQNQEEQFEIGGTLLQSYLQLYSTFTRMAATMTQQQYNYELSLLQERLDKEQISREQYERQRANLARENFRKQKEFSITQAIINTALGVTNAFATAPNIILGAVLAGTVAAVGAAEIATIASQPVPKFAEGGFVNEHGEIKGRKHAQGGVVIEAEGSEFITKGKYAQQNADILKAINSGQWEKYKMENIIAPAINQVLEGGLENMGASYTLNTGWTDKNLLRQGDRNRYAMRDGFVYLGDRMEKALTRKSKSRYV